MEFGIANVAAITVLVYLIAAGIKATPLDNKWLPVICGVAGIILGLAATGINQIGKQLAKDSDTEGR